MDPLLAWLFLEFSFLDWNTDTVSGEDPTSDEWLLLDISVHLLVVLFSEGFANSLFISFNSGLDSDVVSWGFPTKIDLVVVWFPASVSETFILWSVNVNL